MTSTSADKEGELGEAGGGLDTHRQSRQTPGPTMPTLPAEGAGFNTGSAQP